MMCFEGMSKSMTRFRSVAAAPLLALLAAPLLSGCMETVAQGMAESDMRARSAGLAAQGNPVLPTAEQRAATAKFESQFAIFGTDPTKLELDRATPCALAPEKAFEMLRGVPHAEFVAAQRAAATSTATMLTDLKAVRVGLLAGQCGPDGPVGPAILVGSYRDIMRVSVNGAPHVTVTDGVARVEGLWINGKREGAFSTVQMISSSQLSAGQSGALQEQVHDWAYLNEITRSPTAVYSYDEFRAGKPGPLTVVFTRNPVSAIYGTMVSERLDDVHGVLTSYNGNRLSSEQRTKNGKLHGWLVIQPSVYNDIAIPGRRICYQNGEEVKALDCPST